MTLESEPAAAQDALVRATVAGTSWARRMWSRNIDDDPGAVGPDMVRGFLYPLFGSHEVFCHLVSMDFFGVRGVYSVALISVHGLVGEARAAGFYLPR